MLQEQTNIVINNEPVRYLPHMEEKDNIRADIKIT